MCLKYYHLLSAYCFKGLLNRVYFAKTQILFKNNLVFIVCIETFNFKQFDTIWFNFYDKVRYFFL